MNHTKGSVEMPTIRLGSEQFVEAPLWWHLKGLMQTATGYGRKLTTTQKVNIGNRSYRVYCHCFSNVGSIFIVMQGVRIFIRED
jgi:hypothetical protein